MKRLLCFALLTFFYGIAGQAQAQTVTQLAGADKTAASTQTQIIAAGSGVGTGIIAVALSNQSTGTLNSCTDNAGTPNTYVVDQAGTNTQTADGITIYSCRATVTSAIAVTTGSVSMTFSGSIGIHISINQVSAMTASPLDQNPTGFNATFASNHTLTAGGSNAGTNDVVFSMCGSLNSSVALTSGYTALETNVQQGATGRYYSTAYKVLASGTPAATCTLGGSNDLVLFLTSYKTAILSGGSVSF